MRRLAFFTIILLSCSSIPKIKMDYSVLNCRIIEIKEYQYAFRLMALKENDTILIISLKENYYTKYGYKKPVLNDLEEIRINENYDFYLTQKMPNVSTMEQLGAFIIIEKDTLWESQSYKEIPLSFISRYTIGNFFIKNAPK